MKFTIKRINNENSYRHYIKLYAVDENNKEIFGADVELYRSKEKGSDGWTINWASCGAKTLENKLPEFKVIKAGMELLQELNNVIIIEEDECTECGYNENECEC